MQSFCPQERRSKRLEGRASPAGFWIWLKNSRGSNQAFKNAWWAVQGSNL
jgi:hypothetical protein